MHNLPRVILSANTRCCRCGGNLFEGQHVIVIWDTDLDGWKHRHPRSGLCHHRNRNLYHMEVMEAIYGTCNTDPADATKTRYFNQKCSSFVDEIPISKQQVIRE